MAGDKYLPPTKDEWSKFVSQLGISDSSHSQFYDSSSGNPEFDKICVLIECYGYNETYGRLFDCWVYIIDVNSSSSDTISKLEPCIRWDLVDLGHEVFAILGSTLYMFGGSDPDNNNGLVGCNMSFYDMKPALSSYPETKITHLTKGSVKNGRRMKAKKEDPAAVVLGDSKICVFSTRLYLSCFAAYESPPRPSFELLDTNKLTWKSLPEPPINYEDHEVVRVCSYCVYRSCCLIIFVPFLGTYGINVYHQKPIWVTLDRSESQHFPFDGMFAMVDNLCFKPYSVIEWGGAHSYPIKIEAPTNRRESVVTAPVASYALCFDDMCNNICIVQGAITYPDYTSPDYPKDIIQHLLVDILKCGNGAFEKLGSDPSKWPEIQTYKSSTFALETCICNRFRIIGCFPIKDAQDAPMKKIDQGKMKKKRKGKGRKQ